MNVRVFVALGVAACLTLACTPSTTSKSKPSDSAPALTTTAERLPIPEASSAPLAPSESQPRTTSPSTPSASVRADGKCARDLDCAQEPDLHPCCGPEGRPVPPQMNCAVKSVECRLLRTCERGTCVGQKRACKKAEDCLTAGGVHPCCFGNAPKAMNCAVKKVDCSGARECNDGYCSPPRSLD